MAGSKDEILFFTFMRRMMASSAQVINGQFLSQCMKKCADIQGEHLYAGVVNCLKSCYNDWRCARLMEPGAIEIICEGAGKIKEMSEIVMDEIGEITLQAIVSAGVWQTVTMRVSRGCVQIDELEFAV